MIDLMEKYLEFDRHLMQDEKPSDFFYSLLRTEYFLNEYPFTMMSSLMQIEQSREHHPEGNVFIHTMMVLDEAAKRKQESMNPRAFLWAALLHDTGKAETTSAQKGRITAYNHEIAGERLSFEFLKQISGEEKFAQEVSKLVRWHMMILFVNKNLPFGDLGSMLQQTDAREIALLGLCDRLGRGALTETGKQKEEAEIKQFLLRCRNRSKKTIAKLMIE